MQQCNAQTSTRLRSPTRPEVPRFQTVTNVVTTRVGAAESAVGRTNASRNLQMRLSRWCYLKDRLRWSRKTDWRGRANNYRTKACQKRRSFHASIRGAI